MLIALPSLAIAFSYLIIINFTTLSAVVTAQAIVGISAVIIGPSVAAITLGLVGNDRLDKRVGRNQALNHAGNVVAAIVAAVLGQFVGRVWIFYFLGILCIASVITVFGIRNRDIDNKQARGEEGGSERATFKDLLGNRSFIIFGICVILFYLAN